MAFLSDADRLRILAAVRAAEQETRGEFVTVVAGSSDRYLFVPTLAAALAALLLPGVLWSFGLATSFAALYVAQLVLFAVLALVLPLPPFIRLLVPERVQRARCRRFAAEQFLALGLDRTAEGTGILLFVSVAEHHVELLADHGIAEVVPPEVWAVIVQAFIADVRRGRVGDGFVTAIGLCGRLLAAHFPAAPDNRNELADRLIEL